MILDQPGAVVHPRASAGWLGVAFVLVILPYLLLAAFAHPIGDDFTYAFDTRRDGLWTAYREQYLSWNGRYASNLLVLGGPMVQGSIAVYKLIAAGMIGATAAAAYGFIRALARDSCTRGQAAIAALGFTALYLVAVPALGESVYWYTGAVTYQLSVILATVQAALVIHALTGGRSGSSWRLAAGTVVVAAVVGMNETVMSIMMTFYGALLLVAAVEGQRHVARVAGWMLAVAVACGLVVWLAPGNSVRSASYPARHDVAHAATYATLQTVRFAADWATSGPLLLASWLYLPLGSDVARRAPLFRAMTRRGCVALVVGALLTIAIAAFLPYWATGVLGQHRTMSVAYFVFLLLWFTALTAMIAIGWVQPGSGWFDSTPRRAVVALLLVTSLAVTRNGYRVAVDFIRGRPFAFDREMEARYAALRACATTPQSRCLIRPVATRPEALYVLDGSPDPGDWVNKGYAYYFGAGQVVVRPEP